MTENAGTGKGRGRGTGAAEGAQQAAQKMSEDFSAAAINAGQQMSEGVEATVARIRELNERAIEAARAAGLSSLDAYEKALQSFVSVEERLANASQLDWVKAIVGAQAEFVQNISGTYLNAARDMLNAASPSSGSASSGSSGSSTSTR
jgi:hypothetical protein